MGQIILFAQQKGGSGKTMLLSQLAVAAGQAGRSVSIVDLDPQRSASEWVAQRTNRQSERDNISLIESANWRAAADILKAGKTSDLVFIDSPGTAEVLKRVALRAADFCLIPCQPSAADVWACRHTLELVEQAGVPHRVVLNRVPPRSNAADAAMAELAGQGAPVMEETLGARSAFAEAFMKGAGVTETARRSKAAEEIVALMAALGPVMAG